jgi:hypothetical protein
MAVMLASIGIGPVIVCGQVREVPGLSPRMASFAADYGMSEPIREILPVR